MYNLIVSGNHDAYSSGSIILEFGRCAREYTNGDITRRFGAFTEEQITEIKRFPTLFCYERGIQKNPHLGKINEITVRQDKVRLDFQLFEMQNFVDHLFLASSLFEFDISDWELNRTHWAIKDVDLAKEFETKGVFIPDWIKNDAKRVDITKHTFDVALSFPGTSRVYVKGIAQELESLIGPNSYFYDENYKAQLARPSLDTLLQDIYGKRSRLIVVFVGEKYQEKDWCGIEFRAIRDIISKREHDRVMFVRLDDGRVEGVLDNDGYIDSRTHEASAIAKFIKERIDLLT